MVAEGTRQCRPGTRVTGVAAEFGVPYIATHSELAIAGHALLDLLSRHHHGHDAVVVGAFCHRFVAAAKELLPIPVIGLAEAGMRAAQLLGRRVGLISIGSLERGSNADLIAEIGVGPDMASCRMLGWSGTELVANQAGADAAVVELGLAAIKEDGADVLVLGGAAFAGMAERITSQLPVPVISPVHYAVGLAELTVLSGWTKPSAGPYAPPDIKATFGLSPQLAAYFGPSEGGGSAG